MVDVEALQRELVLQRQENAAQREQIAKLIDQIATLTDRVTELLSVAQHKGRRPVVEKPPAPAPDVDDDARRTFDDRPRPPSNPVDEPAETPRVSPTGRKPVPVHLEAEEHALRPDACEHCGSTELAAADLVVEEKLHAVKEHQRRRVVRRMTCRCRSCGGRTTPR